MNELQVRSVPFMGADLMAAQDASGQVWAGVRWVCDGIGLNDNQTRHERKRITEDRVLSKGGSNLTLPTKGGKQEVLCLKLDYVPLWLAKISITPTMEQDNPELADRLEQYQLRAKDVLAAAFIPKSKHDNVSDMLAEARMNNSIARRKSSEAKKAEIWLKLSQVNPILTYQQICAHYASAELTGGEAVLPLPPVQEKTYSAAEVGAMLGGISANMIGRVANQNGLKTTEYGLEVWDKAKSSAKQVPTWRYNEKAVERIRAILGEGATA